MLAFGFSEYHEKFISSRERKDEGERTNGTEEGHGSPATGSWSGSGGGGGPRVTESPGFFWLGHRSLTGHLRDSSPSCYIMGTSSDDFSIDCLHVGEREGGIGYLRSVPHVADAPGARTEDREQGAGSRERIKDKG